MLLSKIPLIMRGKLQEQSEKEKQIELREISEAVQITDSVSKGGCCECCDYLDSVLNEAEIAYKERTLINTTMAIALKSE